MCRACALLLLVIGASLLPVSAVFAHEMRPAIVTASPLESGRVDFEVKTNLEALIAGISPNHTDTDAAPNAAAYKALRALHPSKLAQRFRKFSRQWLAGIHVTVNGQPRSLTINRVFVPDVGSLKVSRISVVTLSANLLTEAQTFTWRYDRKFGSSVVRVKSADGEITAAGWLQDGKPSPPVAVSGQPALSFVSLFSEYLWLGFTHIVPKGLDHILFVLGLYLLNPGFRPLITQITAFTVAHSITLALGLYGIVQISPSIVEPLIAASIVYVAIENLITHKLTPWRPVVVFAFGLLHGLGFAGVLQDIGLPQDAYVYGLVAFNIGVEGGQLAVIAIAWLLTGMLFASRSWYRPVVVWPGSLCIACIGLYWAIERISLI